MLLDVVDGFFVHIKFIAQVSETLLVRIRVVETFKIWCNFKFGVQFSLHIIQFLQFSLCISPSFNIFLKSLLLKLNFLIQFRQALTVLLLQILLVILQVF